MYVNLLWPCVFVSYMATHMLRVSIVFFPMYVNIRWPRLYELYLFKVGRIYVNFILP